VNFGLVRRVQQSKKQLKVLDVRRDTMRAYHVLGAAAIVAVLVFAGCEKTRRVEVQYRQQVVTMPAQPQPAPVQPQIGPVGPPPPPVVVPSTVTAADVVVETRGPVHEAFAEPVTVNPQPTFVIPQAPPQPVEEMPPDERPAGVNVVWIPGYWSWDDDRNGFVWISGIWRVPPPNCTWQPGYWAQTTGGYQWVSGYWMAQAVQEVVYLPAPPATLEAGPVGLAPSDDYLWVPGCWYWTTGRYAWRPGTWAVARSEWVWVPAHYIWTPRGYLFIDGHWDYTLERRGILFAPVYFARPVYLRPDYYYSPEVVIDTGSLTVCLFSRPAYCHYYFGDYYDAGYARRGIYPWYEYRDRHDWYDPIYSHEIWQHRRDDPKWDEHARGEFKNRQDNRDLRPPRTLVEQQKTAGRLSPIEAKKVTTALPLSVFSKSAQAGVKFEPVTPARRKEIEQQTKDIQKSQATRVQQERVARPELPRSPTTAPQPVNRGPTTAPKPEERVTTPPTTVMPTRTTPPEVKKPVDRTVTPEVRKPDVQPITQPEVRPVLPEVRKLDVQPIPTPETRTPRDVRPTEPPAVRPPTERQPVERPEVRKPEERPAPPVVRTAPPEVRSAPPEVRSAPPVVRSVPEVRSAPPERSVPEVRSAPPEPRPAPEVRSAPPEPRPAPEVRSAPPEPRSAPEVRSAPPEARSAPEPPSAKGSKSSDADQADSAPSKGKKG
jgi:hypothetical protein